MNLGGKKTTTEEEKTQSVYGEYKKEKTVGNNRITIGEGKGGGPASSDRVSGKELRKREHQSPKRTEREEFRPDQWERALGDGKRQNSPSCLSLEETGVAATSCKGVLSPPSSKKRFGAERERGKQL